jgi:hypothetical protein
MKEIIADITVWKVVGCLLLCLFGFSVRLFYLAATSPAWPTVTGTLLELAWTRSEDGVSPKVKYSYVVNGISYTRRIMSFSCAPVALET